jgi:hypothetical protein
MKKMVFTVNIGDKYKDVCSITIPFIKLYAEKIGASFFEIREKKFKDFPFTYEKMQIYELGRDNDWNIYIDADYLIRPDLFDVTQECPIDAVGHWGAYEADVWFMMDEVFLNDTNEVEEVITPPWMLEGEEKVEKIKVIRPRYIGFTDGFVVASKNCHEIWKPLEFSYEEALYRARRHHFIGEYTLARNLAANHYKSFTFQSEERKKGAQSDNSVLFHLEMTKKRGNVDLRQIKDYLEGKIDSF